MHTPSERGRKPLNIDSLSLVGVLAFCGCADNDDSPWVFPEIVESSVYVDYGAWADVSDVCMGDKLAAWDRYIEDVTRYLGVDPPKGRIRYTWFPEGAEISVDWPCNKKADGCVKTHVEGDQAVVFNRTLESMHELAHAVELPATEKAHPVFREGMAEYLSRSSTTDAALRDFPAEITRMMDSQDVFSYSYTRAMHFVGSLIERGGLERYYEFHDRVAVDGGTMEFENAYRAVYGEELFDALEEMASAPIRGRWRPWGCEEENSSLVWSSPELLEVTLHGECGDGGFFGGGFVEGQPVFSKYFTLDVEYAGYYRVTLQGGDGRPSDSKLEIVSCPTVDFSDNPLPNENGLIMVWKGRHQIRVDYSSSSAARSGVKLRLENLNPVL